MFNKMVILDFKNCEVIFCNLTHNQEPEELISERGLSPENCQWMIESEKLPIKVIW